METLENGNNQSSLANDNKMLSRMMMVRISEALNSVSERDADA